ncbi:hypothetical protein RCL_jg23034.t2 [Rhizophagus clarus]|uniref:Uncharacterized protein n=1 Tax=Rhizophagus clarus TaxID=94130 RepID=A0A8H3L3R3_9GLOM|nr:hypothetical protein RCL_jg23034.t2 [Rhizophagus clarus]
MVPLWTFIGWAINIVAKILQLFGQFLAINITSISLLPFLLLDSKLPIEHAIRTSTTQWHQWSQPPKRNIYSIRTCNVVMTSSINR